MVRKYLNSRILRIGFLSALIVSGIAVAAPTILSHVPTAHAFTTQNACETGPDENFLSPRSGSAGLCTTATRWDVMSLTTSADGSSTLDAGQTIRVTVSYNVNQPIPSTFNGQNNTPDLWLNFVTSQQNCSPANVSSGSYDGCISDPTRGASSAPDTNDGATYGSGCPSGYNCNNTDSSYIGGTNVELDNSCPAFYDADSPSQSPLEIPFNSHYADPNIDDASHQGKYNSPFTGQTGNTGVSGCSDGKSVLWSNTAHSSTGVKSYSASFTIASGAANNSSFCIEGEMAIGSIPDLYARDTQAGGDCWTVVQPQTPTCTGSCGGVTTIAGTITDADSGNGIGGVPVTQADSYASEDTPSSGCRTNYSTPSYFFPTIGGNYSAGFLFYDCLGHHFALSVPSSYSDPNTGYLYQNPTPVNASGGLQNNPGGTTYSGQVAGLDCASFTDTSSVGENCTNWQQKYLLPEIQDSTHILKSTTPANAPPGSAGLCSGQNGSSNGSEGVVNDWGGNDNENCTQDSTTIETGVSGSCQSIAGGGYGDDTPGYNGDSDETCHTSGSGLTATRSVYKWKEYVTKYGYQSYIDDLSNSESCGSGCSSSIVYNWQYTPYVTISGSVGNITLGAGYSGVTVYTAYSGDGSCDANPVTTDGNGNFSFQEALNAGFCVAASGYSYEPGEPTTVNTDAGMALDAQPLNPAYVLGQFAGYAGQVATYGNQTASGNEGGFYFYYTNPVLSLSKTVSTGTNSFSPVPAGCPSTGTASGTCVKPGQTLTYTMTANNAGGDTSNYALEDFIPENIDPTTAAITSVTYNGNALSCPSNTVSSSTDYGGYICGIKTNFSQTAYDSGGPSDTPTEIFVQLSDFTGSLGSGGGSLVVTWTGKVYAAPQVGVFPANYSFCANAGNFGTRSACDDFTNGLEAVSNFARSSYHYPGDTVANYGATPGPWSGWGINSAGAADNRGGAASSVIVNPIPASVTCVSKAVSGIPTDPTRASQPTSTECDGSTTNDWFLYVPNDSSDDAPTMNLEVQRNTTEGPLYYALYDQTPATGVYGDINVNNGSESSPNYTGAVGGPGAQLSWGNSTTPAGQELLSGSTNTPGTFSFTATMIDGTPVVAAGSSFPNSAEVCPVQYWVAGHSTGPNNSACVQSNVVHFTRYNNNSPYVTTTNGDVHAGSTITPVTGGFCSTGSATINPGVNTVFNNGSTQSIGQYLVTAGNNVSGSWNGVIANAANVATANGVGVIIRPNLCNAAAQASTKQGGVINANGSTGVLPWPSDSSYNDNAKSTTNPSGIAGPAGATANVDGKVVTVNGNYTLGSATVGAAPAPAAGNAATPPQITINNRWTLYVTGNLYINANIAYGTPVRTPSTGSPSDAEVNHPSFGVIVEGNIYIAKNVTSLAGFYVSSQVVNTCATYDGKSLTYETSTPTTYAGAYSVLDCDKQLQVDGILYADSFRLNRTYGYNGATGPAEQVNDDDRLYTATPPAFNALVTAAQISQYLVEPLPRY